MNYLMNNDASNQPMMLQKYLLNKMANEKKKSGSDFDDMKPETSIRNNPRKPSSGLENIFLSDLIVEN